MSRQRDRGDLSSPGKARGHKSVPRLYCASRPFDQDSSGLLQEEMLMWSPVPANQGSEPLAHSFSKRRKARGASRRIETWGFPSLGERRLGLPPHPRPKCQVSSRGGGGLRDLPSRAAQAAKSTLPLRGQGRARTHTHNTPMHIHTLKRVHRHTRTDVLPRRGRRWLLAARTFRASRRAGRAGRGAGSREIDNRFGGLQRTSLL